jgi:hypothetical protein
VPKFVSTFRAVFDAETDGVAQVTAERCLEAIEEILGEEDEEGKPSYKLQLTEVTKFDSGTSPIEIVDLACQLRNKLITTKSKDAIDLACELDRVQWLLRHSINSDDADKEILPQYDRARMWEICEAVWRGDNPTE